MASRRVTAKRTAKATGGLLAAAAVFAPMASAETFDVNSLLDNGDGTCDATCTLRDAVQNANSNPNSPADVADVITFAANVRGTIQLQNSSLNITEDGVDIQGPGADLLSVVAPQADGVGQDRVFKIFGFVTDEEDVTISGLTVTGGGTDQLAFNENGGGILSTTNGGYYCDGSAANLTLSGLWITDNGANWSGGGVAVDQGYCYSETTKQAVSGPGSLTVIDTTVSGNTAASAGGGVAMLPQSGPLSVSNSTIAGNDAGWVGGGISIVPDFGKAEGDSSTFDADNSTITHNNSDEEGGGIFSAADFGLRSTIVHGNTVTTDDSQDKAIIANDLANNSTNSFSAGYSLIGTRDGATVVDVPGEPNLSADPQLGTLGDNGGPTPTELPAITSPAIDTGISNSLTGDQRGEARTVDRDPANTADGTDIGATELPADPIPEPDPDPDPIPGPAPDFCFDKQVILTKGGDADEKLTGYGGDDGIFAGGGRDDVFGIGGDDCLYGQVGNDLVEGGPGDDNANGDRDDDKVKGDGGADSVRGQNGDDRVFGGPGDDPKVTGGAGDDYVKGGAGDDFVKGDGGNDVIELSGGADFVHSGGGADVVNAADGERDTIICGTGKDVANVDPVDKVDKDCNVVNIVSGSRRPAA